MKGMGFRTIKTAIGAGMALWIANLFQIEFATFSVIIVIICIEKTKRKTLISMKDKFFASLISLVLGSFLFEFLGYAPIVFSIFIFIFVPILVWLHITAGFVTGMVVLTHVYLVGNANVAMFLNEMYLIIIGMGIVLLVNSFMPNLREDIKIYKQAIEEKFEIILFEFSAHLRDSSRTWSGRELLEVEDLINKAKSVSIQHVENHLMRKENKDYYYLEMRGNQLELLKQMIKIIAIFTESSLHVKQKEMLADFLENVSRNVHAGDTTDASLHELEQLRIAFRKTELPKTRVEFEVRANLFYLIFEMENYLMIKKKLFKKESKEIKELKLD